MVLEGRLNNFQRCLYRILRTRKEKVARRKVYMWRKRRERGEKKKRIKNNNSGREKTKKLRKENWDCSDFTSLPRRREKETPEKEKNFVGKRGSYSKGN